MSYYYSYGSWSSSIGSSLRMHPNEEFLKTIKKCRSEMEELKEPKKKKVKSELFNPKELVL